MCAVAVRVMGVPAENEALLLGLVRLQSEDTVTGLTTTLTIAEVVEAPRLSVAFAVSECVPAGTLVHGKLYGAIASSPSLDVPLKNSTLLIAPPTSAALALIVTVVPALTVALFAGAVMFTVGGLFPVLTTIRMALDVVTAFLSSVAFAVIV